MKKRLSEAEWAKVRYDREHKGYSFRELADKYKVGIGTIHRKAKEGNWIDPESEQSNGTQNGTPDKPRSKKSNDVKPQCLQDESPDDEPEEQEETPKKDKYRFKKRNAVDENGTQSGTPENEKDFDVKGYVESLKQNFDPSRVRDQKFMAFQLSQIDEHLGDLSSVFDSDGITGKYRPQFARIAYNIALLGGTPEHLAKTLNVSEQTIYNWLKTYPEFQIAWHGGKDFADANVVKALYKRAIGYNEVVEDFKSEKGELVPIDKTLVFPPDVNAQIFWLKNRQPHLWKEKVDVQEEVQVAVIDQQAAEEKYNRILDKAAGLKAELHGRKQRLGLILDGESQEIS